MRLYQCVYVCVCIYALRVCVCVCVVYVYELFGADFQKRPSSKNKKPPITPPTHKFRRGPPDWQVSGAWKWLPENTREPTFFTFFWYFAAVYMHLAKARRRCSNTLATH